MRYDPPYAYCSSRKNRLRQSVFTHPPRRGVIQRDTRTLPPKNGSVISENSSSLHDIPAQPKSNATPGTQLISRAATRTTANTPATVSFDRREEEAGEDDCKKNEITSVCASVTDKNRNSSYPAPTGAIPHAFKIAPNTVIRTPVVTDAQIQSGRRLNGAAKYA